MFGFMKKSVPPSEFGLWVLKYADGFVSNDACRSLGTTFPDCDASRGWTPVFEKNGVPIPIVKLYVRYYTHCVLQSIFKVYSGDQRRTMVHGAISAIQETPVGYDFGKTFNDIEAVFDGNYKFNPRIASLNDDGRLNYLAVPNAHVLISKYLIHQFVLQNMKNSKAFIDGFGLFSSTVGASLASAYRAMNAVTSKVRVG